MVTESVVREALAKVNDPALGPVVADLMDAYVHPFLDKPERGPR